MVAVTIAVFIIISTPTVSVSLCSSSSSCCCCCCSSYCCTLPIDINRTNCIYFNCCKSLNSIYDMGISDSVTKLNVAGIIM